MSGGVCRCVCVCARARARVCVCVCVCVLIAVDALPIYTNRTEHPCPFTSVPDEIVQEQSAGVANQRQFMGAPPQPSRTIAAGTGLCKAARGRVWSRPIAPWVPAAPFDAVATVRSSGAVERQHFLSNRCASNPCLLTRSRHRCRVTPCASTAHYESQ